MRTTLSIDDDISAAAKCLAQRDHETMREAVSGLIPDGLACASSAGRNGVPLLHGHGNAIPVTPDLVSQLCDELP